MTSDSGMRCHRANLSVQVQACRVQSPQLVYPIALSSELFILAPHAFNCLKAEVTERVTSAGKMSSYRFSVRLCKMSFRCPFRWMWRGFCVSPTYCLWHFLHSIRQMMLLDLQVAVARVWQQVPVVVLLIYNPIAVDCYYIDRHMLQKCVPGTFLPRNKSLGMRLLGTVPTQTPLYTYIYI